MSFSICELFLMKYISFLYILSIFLILKCFIKELPLLKKISNYNIKYYIIKNNITLNTHSVTYADPCLEKAIITIMLI